MQGFPQRLRFLGRATRELAAILFVASILASTAVADPHPVDDPSAPGAYCAIGQCRPVAASAWTPAAFALTVLAIGRGARRGAARR